MRRTTLGKTGLEVSVVGFGGIPIQGISFTEAEKVLLRSVDRGINFFDSARGYTDSEEKMGRALIRHRDEIILASKSLSRSAEGITAELETSLHNMRTRHIDIYQIHSVGSRDQLDAVLSPGGAYEALDKARQDGKIRWIGITGHFRPVLVEAVRTGLFDTVQMPYNPIETEWETDLIPEARKLDVGTIGMKPLAGGALTNAGASIRFALSRGIDVSIPGMDSVEQVDENAAAGAAPAALTDVELAELLEEKEVWGGTFCRRCGYCMPCPEGLNIPFLLLIEAYYTRYGLKDWANKRLATLEKRYEDCTGCEECLDRCPYNLPIPDLMKRARGIVV